MRVNTIIKVCIIAAVVTAAFIFSAINIWAATAYVKGSSSGPEIEFSKGGAADKESYAPSAPPIIPVVEETYPEPVSEQRPFTPPGTGTVVDNVTNEDGKEFFTITSAAGNIFFLIIDRQRNTENVYFLNAVTERDLLALAEEAGEDWAGISVPPPIIPDTPEPVPELVTEPVPVPAPEQGGGMGMVIILIVLILGGGAGGYYFKVYLPKQQGADMDDDFDYEGEYTDGYTDESEPYGEYAEDDMPPWDTDESGRKDKE